VSSLIVDGSKRRVVRVPKKDQESLNVKRKRTANDTVNKNISYKEWSRDDDSSPEHSQKTARLMKNEDEASQKA
jgi:hypothetical protein